jgi:hypothetical protein
MRSYCGLVNADAACSCARRVPYAIRDGRVDPNHMLFAGQGDAPPRRLPILEAVDEMDGLHQIAAIHQSHPTLSSQLYAQRFLSAAAFSGYKAFVEPSVFEFMVYGPR